MASTTVDPAALYAYLVYDESIGATSPLQHSTAAAVSPFDAATSIATTPQLEGSQLGQQPAYLQPSASTDIASSSLYCQPGMSAPSLLRSHSPPGVCNVLTPAPQERLRSTALPSYLQFPSPQSISSPESVFGLDRKRGSSSPEMLIVPRPSFGSRHYSHLQVGADDPNAHTI
jgi:hypothetical protein